MIAEDLMIHRAPAPARRPPFNQPAGKRFPARQRSGRSKVVSPARPVQWVGGFEIKPAPAGPFIEPDTDLLPLVVAESVWQEACGHLKATLPREWVPRLANRADLVYQRNARFRARIRGRGDTGRDYLWMFNRHWLAALIKEHFPQLYEQLPAEYSVGKGLA